MESKSRPSAALSHEAIDSESWRIRALEYVDQRDVHAPARNINRSFG